MSENPATSPTTAPRRRQRPGTVQITLAVRPETRDLLYRLAVERFGSQGRACDELARTYQPREG